MGKIYTIEEIRNKVRPIAERYGIDTVWLFGSYARGEATENSDVDLLVGYKKGMGLQFFGFEADLEDAFDVSLDVLSDDGIYNPVFQEKHSKFIRNFERDRVRLI